MKKNKGTKVSKSRRKKIDIKKMGIITLIILILFLIIIKNRESVEKNEDISLIINNEDITKQLENEILIQDNIVYISFEDIKKCLDKTIYFEDETNLIITSSDKKIAALELDNNDIEINGSNVSIEAQLFKTEDDNMYIPISELENVYDVDFSYIEENKKIIIDHYAKGLTKAYTRKKVSVKMENKKFSKTVSKVDKGNWVIFVSEENGWSKIRTQEGVLGYVKSKNLTNFITEREDMNELIENTETEYLEVDITNENINLYDDRKQVINEILTDVISKEYKKVKIKYDSEENESYQRFRIEIVPILKECGITVIFE